MWHLEGWRGVLEGPSQRTESQAKISVLLGMLEWYVPLTSGFFFLATNGTQQRFLSLHQQASLVPSEKVRWNQGTSTKKDVLLVPAIPS